jgi:Putative beta-barrel porin 2
MGRCRSSAHKTRAHRHVAIWIALAVVAFIRSPLIAQTVEINPTISSAAAPLPADDKPSGDGLISGALGEYNLSAQFAFHLSFRGAYDDNIALTHMNRIDDRFVQIQPSVMFGVGQIATQENFLMVNYLPSFYRYDDHPEFDSNQHIGRLLAGIKTDKWTVRFDQEVAYLQNIVLAASSGEFQSLTPTGRTNLGLYSTDLSVNYNFTPRDFLFTEALMNRRDYASPLVSSQVYAADLYFNHGFNPQVVLGLGVEGGFNNVDFPTPDQSFIQANVHFNYTPSKIFSLDIIAGEEFRDFEDISPAIMARDTYTTPVFSIGAAFTPNDNTKITLGASRQISNSAALTAQDYTDTSVNAMIRERVCRQLYLAVFGGYEHVKYFNTLQGVNLPTLSDDYWYVQPSADILLTRYWSFGGYYLRRQNSGSVSTVDFYANEYGVRTTIKF